jgi:hypothetical protein
MSPGNRRNPDRTDLLGRFGWDVLPGFYTVLASRRGCDPPGGTRTRVLPIPPPIDNLVIKLHCARLRRAASRLSLSVVRVKNPTGILTYRVMATVRPARGRARPAGSVRFRGPGGISVSAPLSARGTAQVELLVPRRGRFRAAFPGDAQLTPSIGARSA